MDCMQWPGCLEVVKPPNAGLRLFGGAAFERCLNEFQVAANMLAFPSSEPLTVRMSELLKNMLLGRSLNKAQLPGVHWQGMLYLLPGVPAWDMAYGDLPC